MKDCKHERQFWISGQCNDMCGWGLEFQSTPRPLSQQDGYVPDGLGLGGGDDLEITVCLDCREVLGLNVDAILALTNGEDG